MSEELVIRAINEHDLHHLWHLIHELGKYQKMTDDVKCSVQDLRDSLFPSPEAVLSGQVVNSARVFFLERALTDAERVEPGHFSSSIVNDQPSRLILGYCLYYFQYSTFLGQNNVHVEDLFTRQPYRSQGYGTKFFHSIIHHALVYHRAKRVEWEVLHDNHPAIQFYQDKCGAQPKGNWIGYRVSDEELDKFRLLEHPCQFIS